MVFEKSMVALIFLYLFEHCIC